MSQQVARADTLFLHEAGDDFLVVIDRDGSRVFRGTLELKETDAGPRPRRFLKTEDSGNEPLRPEEFVEIARSANRIRISQQTSTEARQRLKAMLKGYQQEALVVRTCRYCANAGRYSPITEESAIVADRDHICQDCAIQELERELSFKGQFTGAAQDRLEELLLEVGDLDRIIDLLQGELDPDLTQFDTISATTDEVDPYPTSDLDLHPVLQEMVEDRFEHLLPVQSLAVENGLFGSEHVSGEKTGGTAKRSQGRDQLVVSATATGKTLVGELAGVDRALRGEGKMLFLVPLVALANQKHEDFEDRYGDHLDVTLRVGGSRVTGSGAQFDPSADIIVGTYEGIDHGLRTGKDMGDIGTVVIDEIHSLKEGERGHRLDGMISRLKYYCEQRQKDRREYDGAPASDANGSTSSERGEDYGTQFIYLSATVGNPEWLGKRLEATLIEFEERPVPIERHVTFADGREKLRIENRLVQREFDTKSSKGYRGQTIIFTNSRRRCHEVSRKLEYSSAPYHAGLDYGKRKQVERKFGNQELSAVVTTAALAAGVDFPASQVIFDSLAMGIEWLSVQEFSQMLGRAGRPDYHDKGTVYLLVEPDAVYHGSMEATEDEIAFKLLKGEMEDVSTVYDEAAAAAETLANIVVAGKLAKRLNERMLGNIPTKHAVGKLLEWEFIAGFEPTPLGRAVTTHFLSPEDAFRILEGIRDDSTPYELVSDLELADQEL